MLADSMISMNVLSAPAPRAYVPAFDGLRAVAAIAVIVAHCAAGRGTLAILNSRIGLGALGVDLFFALSGFLITGILLSVRDGGTPSRGLVNFYMRRACRILPLYYAAVLLYLALGFPGVWANIWWFFGYAVNVGKAVGAKGWAPLNHFWTLSVEEQFYLVWPAVVLWTPNAWFGSVCLVVAVGSLAFRCLMALMGANAFAVTQLTPGCLEPLALGAWFALRTIEGSPVGPLARRITWIGLVATCTCMLLPQGAQDLLGRGAHALLFSPIVSLVAGLREGAVHSILVAPIMRYLGMISYGLYVWHVPVLDAIDRWTPFNSWTASMPKAIAGITLFVVAFPTSIIAASATWFAFERAFIRLKTRFE